jgi:hypothetical protein
MNDYRKSLVFFTEFHQIYNILLNTLEEFLINFDGSSWVSLI